MKFKNIEISFLKLLTLLLFTGFILVSCDEELPIESLSQETNTYTSKFIKNTEVKNKILDKVAFFNKEITKKKMEKSVYSDLYDFTIETDFVFYVEYADGAYSYTFPISRNLETIYKESFVITVTAEGEFITQYFKYDLDLNYLESGGDLSDKITVITLDANDLALEVMPSRDPLGPGHWETSYAWVSITLINPRTFQTSVVGGYWETTFTWVLDGDLLDDPRWNVDGGGSNDHAGGGIGHSSTITTVPQGFLSLQLLSDLVNHGMTIPAGFADWINQSQNNANQAQAVADFLDANNTPEGQVFAQEVMNYLVEYPLNQEYNINNYPGKDLNYPFEWWSDNNFIINSGNFDLPSDNLNMPSERPNSKEVLLFSLFITEAILHIQNANEALEKSQFHAQTGTFNQTGYKALNNGKADAFRHAYWNVLGTADFGSRIMKLFADAHEWNQSGIDVVMDLYNNEVGRNISITNGYNSSTSSQIINTTVEQSVLNGEMNYLFPTGLNGEILSNSTNIPTNQ